MSAPTSERTAVTSPVLQSGWVTFGDSALTRLLVMLRFGDIPAGTFQYGSHDEKMRTDFFTTSVVTENSGWTSTMSPPVKPYTYYPGMKREPNAQS